MGISGEDIGAYAQQFLGTKYVWGGNDLNSGIDCSGLVQQVYKHFGISLPRVTYDQIGEGAPVSMKGLRAGDLVFFDTNPKVKGPDHVGIYLGGGKMINAPRPGKSVEVVDISKGYYLDTFMGGRRVSGVHTTGAHQSDYENTPKMSPEELAASYGWSYGFLHSNPDLKRLFGEAVKDGWDPSRFQAELADTKWWKEHSETQRKAQVTQKTDPATWAAQMNAATIKVKQLAAEMGAAIPESKIKGIAQTMLQTGADEGQMRNALGGYVKFTKDGTLLGEAGMHEYTIKQYAHANGISLSNQAIKNQAQLIVRKMATTQDFESQIRESAKSMYPAYGEQLDAGQTLNDIASPYIQMMSQELGIPDTSLDVMDPTIKKALNGLSADSKPTGLSLTDFQSQLRNDPRWRQTGAAENNVMSIGHQVLKDFGLKE